MPRKGDFRAIRGRMLAAVPDEAVVAAAVLRLLRSTARRRVDPDELRDAAATALADELRARGLPADEGALARAIGELPESPPSPAPPAVRRRWRALLLVALGSLAVTAALALAPLWSRPPTRSDALYLVMVDRFADGRPDAPGTVDRGDPQAWHGGDLPGLLARLDVLDRLGVGAVWITPVSIGRDAPIGPWGAYHGYWVTDVGGVGSRFGAPEDLRALSQALHERGMRLYVDVVYNHVAYDADLVREQPDWFHGRGDVVDWDDPVQRVTHDVHGLPDLAQEDERVYAWLRDRSKALLALADPDGFRVDAVGHLPEGFLARLGADLRPDARPAFELLGEVFDGNPDRLAARAAADGLDAVFDFPLHYAMVDVFCGDAHPGRVAASLRPDYGGARPVTMLDNHDTPRIRSRCGGDLDRVAQALAFQLTARGTPALTWGTEVGLEGALEPLNRGDMVFPDEEPPLAVTIRELLALRAETPALHAGDTRVDALSPGVLVVARTHASGTAVIAVNRTDAPVEVRGLPGARSVIVRGAGQLLPGGATVPARATRIEWSAATTPPAGGEVTLTLSAPPLADPSDRWLLVGAGERLGAWDPERGVPFEDGTATLRAADGEVLAFKLVTRHADGSVTWEPTADRFLLVRSLAECGASCAPATDGRARADLAD